MTEAAKDNVSDTPQKPRLVLVDTNTFLRLYHSPVMPFLGRVVGNYQLLTLSTLIDEFRNSKRLMRDYAWVAATMKSENLAEASIELSAANVALIGEENKILAPYANSILENHCLKNRLDIIRSLSGRDSELLATAVVLEAVIATDEWPLKFVVDDLMIDADEYNIAVITSLDVLKVFELNKLITRDERISTVKAWLNYNEMLPNKWREDYLSLFAERAPSLG